MAIKCILSNILYFRINPGLLFAITLFAVIAAGQRIHNHNN